MSKRIYFNQAVFNVCKIAADIGLPYVLIGNAVMNDETFSSIHFKRRWVEYRTYSMRFSETIRKLYQEWKING